MTEYTTSMLATIVVFWTVAALGGRLAVWFNRSKRGQIMTNAIKMSGTFVRKGTNSRLGETILANEELTRFSRAI